MRRRSVNAPSQDAVAERQRQLAKLGRRGEVHVKARDIVIPSQLKAFASSIISTACGCYVTTPSTTITTTATSTSTSLATVTASFVTSVPGTTVVVRTTVTTTATSTTTLAGITTTTSTTSTVVIPTTTTVTAPGTFTLQFSGSNCVQNKYTHYDLINEAYSTPDRLFQVCAARCAIYGSGCKSFFGYQDNDYPYQWCLIDDAPYNPSYGQCAIPFSGVDLAYNSPY